MWSGSERGSYRPQLLVLMRFISLDRVFTSTIVDSGSTVSSSRVNSFLSSISEIFNKRHRMYNPPVDLEPIPI